VSKDKVSFHCGCGYKCDNPLEAKIHVDETGHTLIIHGFIVPDTKKEERKNGSNLR
jgi:hypothetical protein